MTNTLKITVSKPFHVTSGDPNIVGTDIKGNNDTITYTNNKVSVYTSTQPEYIEFSSPAIDFNCSNVTGKEEGENYLITCDFI
ncbi:MAG: hypothetical protein HRK26_01570 [Rickettsiaceae bacterium H1]|nr:hypothetical protein [Rickettsiaceae bacterium H1]